MVRNVETSVQSQPSKFYIRRLVLIFFFTQGFMFMDRLAITFLFPILAPELHLSNAQLGIVVMVMTLAGDITAWVVSVFLDRSGKRKAWLIPFVVAVALFSGVTALSSSFTSLVLIRLLIGAAEGPIFPLTTSMIGTESDKAKLGKNLGITMSGVMLLGSIIGPVAVTQLAVHSNWHLAFVLVGFPMLIMAFIIGKWTKEVPNHNVHVDPSQKRSELKEVLKNRNVIICMIVAIFSQVQMWVLNTFLPTFLVDGHHISNSHMGLVEAALGAGGLIWGLVASSASDKIGRKTTLVTFSLLGVLMPLLFYFYQGSNWGLLALMSLLYFNSGAMPLFMTIIPNAIVPPRLVATATAVSFTVGEVIGAAVVPAVSGVLADNFGIQVVMIVAMLGALLAGVTGLFFKENDVPSAIVEDGSYKA